ncbi:hypothetical protein FRC12_016167 [Ceratobasidium sp. 428]|nr:hypothetical protein FRC12_016167 [Ceratobasidium sp. 428]
MRSVLASFVQWLRSNPAHERDSLIVRDLGCYVSVSHSGNPVDTDQTFEDPKFQCESNCCVCCITQYKHDRPYARGICTYFPTEIWYRIVESVANYPAFECLQGIQLVPHKGRISPLISLASTSKWLRAIVLQYWARDILLLLHEDVYYLKGLGLHANDIDLVRCVRRIICTDSYQIYRARNDILEPFKFLEELVIDGHSDINFGRVEAVTGAWNPPASGELLDAGDAPPESVTTRMSYRKLKVKLPQTLRKLKVYNSHVPDIYYIHKVARECPELRSLALARCTIFTQSDCAFWKRLPRSESDSYFSNVGVEAYAAAVGKELSKIPKLQEVQIGIYLTDHRAINTHLEQHVGLTIASGTVGVWSETCDECAFEYQETTESCEQAAAEVLAQFVPTLSRVSWLSFFSEGRTGWHTCNVNLKQVLGIDAA